MSVCRFGMLAGLVAVLAISSAVRCEQPGTQIEDPATLSAMRAILPSLKDGLANDILHDRRVIWYTTDGIGVAYQAHSGKRPGDGPVGFADAMAEGRPNQNTVDRFPWGPRPGGLHRAERVDSFKGVWLPKDSAGRLYPIVWYRCDLEGLTRPTDKAHGWNWTFPVGTVVWEVLTMNNDGEGYVFEVRSRWRHIDHWRPRLYRPFPTAHDAAQAILTRTRTEQGSDFVDACYVPATGRASIESIEPGNPLFGTLKGSAFSSRFLVDRLPPLPAELVAELLDVTQFTEVDGVTWKPGCAAPISTHDFHIVPKGGLLPIVGSDEVSCSKCHDTSLTSSRRFGTNSERWGWVRGNHGHESTGGGILSWHPVSPKTFAGRAKANPNVMMRENWTRTGVIAEYDRRIHNARYRRLNPTQ